MSEVHYGRRKDDLMMPGITPEVLTNLTDSQKINIQIIQNLNSLNTAINDIQHDVGIHNKFLITGNGEPNLQERIRNLEEFVKGMKYWGRLIGGAIVLQTIGFSVGIIIAVVRFLPVLEKLASVP